MIPDSKRQAVEKALVRTFGESEAEEITALTAGLSGASIFKIVVASEPYVLRIVDRVDGFHDPAREFACVQAASDAGVAPRLLYADGADGVAISQFIAHRPAVGVSVIRPLVRLIRKVHALPLFPPLIKHLSGVDKFVQEGLSTGLLPRSSVAEHMAFYDEIQAAYPKNDPDLVSSHNDLNPNNILYDGERFWFIDWAAAFASDRYVDLAIIANNFVADDAGEEELLREYFGDDLNDYNRARLFLMRQLCHMCFGMVFVRLASTSHPSGVAADPDMTSPTLREFYGMLRAGQVALGSSGGQLLYAKVLLNESLGMMRTPRFAKSIALVREP